jgi:hypothetical protein
MKHIAPRTLAIVFAIAFVLSIAPSAKADDKGCSNASLKGTFAYTVTGSTSLPPPLGGPFGGIGRQTFDGNGHVSGTQTVNLNGNVLRQTYTGTYTVNPDCTGSVILMLDIPMGLVTHSDFVIDDNGNEIRSVETDSGSVLTVIARRQFPVSDWRQ